MFSAEQRDRNLAASRSLPESTRNLKDSKGVRSVQHLETCNLLHAKHLGALEIRPSSSLVFSVLRCPRHSCLRCTHTTPESSSPPTALKQRQKAKQPSKKVCRSEIPGPSKNCRNLEAVGSPTCLVQKVHFGPSRHQKPLVVPTALLPAAQGVL